MLKYVFSTIVFTCVFAEVKLVSEVVVPAVIFADSHDASWNSIVEVSEVSKRLCTVALAVERLLLVPFAVSSTH